MLNIILSSLILFSPPSVSALDPLPSENTNSRGLILARNQHSPVPDIYDLTYHEARKRLIGAGWQPFKLKGNRLYLNLVTSGNIPVFLKQGYTELIDCSRIGIAFCIFEFTDAHGNYLTVFTNGQEIPKRKSHATVDRWSLHRVPYYQRNGV